MSFDTAMAHFVTPMRRRFTLSSGIDQQGFIEDLCEAMSSYAVEHLAAGASWFKDNRESRTFPTIAECKRVCATTMSGQVGAISREGASRQRQGATSDRIDRERTMGAWKLCRCGMGRSADREGWLVALLEFAEDHGRLPEGREVGDVQAKARRSEDALASLKPILADDERPDEAYRQKQVFYEACCNWRKIMLDRAHENVFGWFERQQSVPTHQAA